MFDWNKASYTKNDLVDAWQICESVTAVCYELEISSSGSSMAAVRRAAESLGLAPKQKMTGLTKQVHRSLEEILVYGVRYPSSSLKKRLWQSKLLPEYCQRFGCTIDDLSLLTLDHIDGDRLNNCLGNLRILCYNCHSQTVTFGSRNRK